MENNPIFDEHCVYANIPFTKMQIESLGNKVYENNICSIFTLNHLTRSDAKTNFYICVRNDDLKLYPSYEHITCYMFELCSKKYVIKTLYTELGLHTQYILAAISEYQQKLISELPYSKLYIAVLDEVPDYMVPTLVAHSVLGADISWTTDIEYQIIDPSFLAKYNDWKHNSFRKVVLKVSRKEFDIIKKRTHCYLGHENKTINGEKSCIVVYPVMSNDVPKILKYAKLWKPNAN